MQWSSSEPALPRVVVVGGGIGAVEAVLALRALVGERVVIVLVSPETHLTYRPLAVAEPFDGSAPRRLPLSRLAETHGVELVHDRVAGVEPGEHVVHFLGGGQMRYDALVVAVGATPNAWLPGALTFRGGPDVPAVRALLGEVEAGTVGHVLFAAPTGMSWTLPLYELALLTASWVADHGVLEVRLTLATPEPTPLTIFGPAAARAVADLLGDRGIELVTDHLVKPDEHGRITLPRLGTLRPDRLVTLPRLTGNPLPGLPADADGFIPTDEHAAVRGLADVYVVGDAAAFEVKQGGLAAQQADAAAAAIAAALGRPVEPQAFTPVMRGMLLTGVAAAYLRSGRADEQGETSRVGFGPLWWPPAKVAGRYLAPYLADQRGLLGLPVGSDVEGAEATARDRDDARRLAVDFAEADAQWGDHHSALRWLEAVERLDGVLSPELCDRRERWARLAGGASVGR